MAKSKTKKKFKPKKRATKKTPTEIALDQALTKINPALRDQIENLSKMINSQQFDFKDIRFLGVRILETIKNVRTSLNEKKPTKKKKSKVGRKKK